MVNKVTPTDIAHFNELYYKLKTYAAVARETGFSASTVKRYIDPNWRPVDRTKFKHVYLQDVPKFDATPLAAADNFSELCIYSVAEKKQIEDLWEELEG